MGRTKEEIRKQLEPLQAELYEIESKETEARISKLVGKFFKFHNSYSGDKRWWLYAKVTGTDGHWPKAFKFEKTSSNEIKITQDDLFTGSGDWTEITSREFYDAFNKTRAEIAAIDI